MRYDTPQEPFQATHTFAPCAKAIMNTKHRLAVSLYWLFLRTNINLFAIKTASVFSSSSPFYLSLRGIPIVAFDIKIKHFYITISEYHRDNLKGDEVKKIIANLRDCIVCFSLKGLLFL